MHRVKSHKRRSGGVRVVAPNLVSVFEVCSFGEKNESKLYLKNICLAVILVSLFVFGSRTFAEESDSIKLGISNYALPNKNEVLYSKSIEKFGNWLDLSSFMSNSIRLLILRKKLKKTG